MRMVSPIGQVSLMRRGVRLLWGPSIRGRTTNASETAVANKAPATPSMAKLGCQCVIRDRRSAMTKTYTRG